MSEALKELERALCEFTNGASDQYNPAEWVAETKRNFEVLCNAYEAAYAAGVFSSALTAGEQEPVAWQNIETPSSILTPEQYGLRLPAMANHYRPLYAAPPTAQLEALRKELAFAKAALSSLSVENDLNKRMFHQASRAAETAEARVAELEKAREEVTGCFDAAYAEGLQERLNDEADRSAGTLYDLVTRRLLFAYEAARRVREGEKVDG